MKRKLQDLKKNNNEIKDKKSKVVGEKFDPKMFPPNYFRILSNECFYENDDLELIKKVFKSLGKK
ncbi:MAG: hypothetical protein ACRDCG_02985 [Mycoplasmoidaceae bacterium]